MQPVPQKTNHLKSAFRLGYTLIEILVGLTIFSLVFLLGFAGYRQFARRQDIAGVARAIKGDIRLAQELALSGKKPAACTWALDGYQFIVIPPNRYEIRAICALHTELEKTVTLSSGTTLSGLAPNFTPANTILFKTLGAGTNITAGSTTSITLSQSDTGNMQVITITAGGEVR